jgi:hypothetical protein
LVSSKAKTVSVVFLAELRTARVSFARTKLTGCTRRSREAVVTSGAEQYRRLARELHFLARYLPLGEHCSALLKLAEEWDRLADQQRHDQIGEKDSPLNFADSRPAPMKPIREPRPKGIRAGLRELLSSSLHSPERRDADALLRIRPVMVSS